MHFGIVLEVLRELRWIWPAPSACGGFGAASVALVAIVFCWIGCLIGACGALLLVSSQCRKGIGWLAAGCASLLVQPEPLQASAALRRRLGQYRLDSA